MELFSLLLACGLCSVVRIRLLQPHPSSLLPISVQILSPSGLIIMILVLGQSCSGPTTDGLAPPTKMKPFWVIKYLGICSANK